MKNWLEMEVEIAPGITKRLGDMNGPELRRAEKYYVKKGCEQLLIGEAYRKAADANRARRRSTDRQQDER